MPLNRRECLFAVTAALAAPALLQAEAGDDSPPAKKPPTSAPASQPDSHLKDAGKVDPNAPDGVDDHHADGYFLIHAKGKVLALSALCTHKSCKVQVENDKTFFCHCHKSRFDADGAVTKGPAKYDLPYLAVHIDDAGHAIVDTDQKITHDQATKNS